MENQGNNTKNTEQSTYVQNKINCPEDPYDPELPINMEEAAEFYGSKEIYLGLLEQYEEMTLDQSIQKLNKAIQEKDFLEIQGIAHSLKGTAGYIVEDKKKIVVLSNDDELNVYKNSIDALQLAKDLKKFIAIQFNKEPNLEEIDEFIQSNINMDSRISKDLISLTQGESCRNLDKTGEGNDIKVEMNEKPVQQGCQCGDKCIIF
ncbi:Signal transduction histidine kinase, phosphotransfer (Hpt) domain [Pseudocohnilembus persalinus]|uniref:Signal transduction histidine kinase, phosphotransfer (Hpt) domain n=1 Tax=Pseudocohnilembus persalinus TaxID=266149 RepID=A0A0V0R429_PSEPJ|nr:Signal transduction histidine kinase, phosphotransfer (Hpt) domain [Pseudocohnilembus persalinus]|eukprot:KRX08981.1 Signal transduction histidine kinase, phosphotransfer (Hpt) domain [Pseudocohnilembus persalinus]